MPEELPYDGAKPMYLVEDLDNKPLLTEIILTTKQELGKMKKQKNAPHIAGRE